MFEEGLKKIYNSIFKDNSKNKNESLFSKSEIFNNSKDNILKNNNKNFNGDLNSIQSKKRNFILKEEKEKEIIDESEINRENLIKNMIKEEINQLCRENKFSKKDWLKLKNIFQKNCKIQDFLKEVEEENGIIKNLLKEENLGDLMKEQELKENEEKENLFSEEEEKFKKFKYK